MSLYVPKGSLLPAILLVGVVGVTFGTLRNYGPESTVRKVHTTVKSLFDAQMTNGKVSSKQWDELRELLIEDPGTPFDDRSGDENARRIIQGLYDEFRSGARYSLAKMDRYAREVRVAVVYSRPNREPYPIIFVVDKPKSGREWRINATKTIQANFL